MMSRIMLAIKLKSPAEMSPVLAIRTARPVIPPKVKLFVNLKKYVPNAIRSVLNVSIKKCLIYSFYFLQSMKLKTLLNCNLLKIKSQRIKYKNEEIMY